MSEKFVETPIEPQSSCRDIADRIGDTTRLHNISDIARQAELERPTIYRAFAGAKLPNFSTVLRVLDAMGFQLKVTERRGTRAKLGRKRGPF